MVGHVRTVKQLQAQIERGLQLRYTHRQDALALGEEALEKAREINCRKTEGRALRLIAACTYYLDREKGFELGVQATEIAKEVEDDRTIAGGYFVQFVFFNDLGMYDRASEAVHAALEHARKAGDVSQQALALFNIGVNTEHRDGNEAAATFYEQAYELSKGLRGDPFQIVIAGAYGKCLADRGKGLDFLKKVLQNALKSGCPFDVLQSYAQLAEAHLAHGEVGPAIALAKEGIEYARKPGAGYFASLYETLGRAYLKLDKAEAALESIEEGLIAASEDTKRVELRLIEIKAKVLRELGRNAQAFDTLEHYVRLRERHLDDLAALRSRQLETVYRVEMAVQDAKNAREQAEQLKAINLELRKTIDQKNNLQREMFRLSSTDNMTGAASRRQLIEEGLLHMEQFKHLSSRFTVLVLDLDHLKTINDEFGTIAGDEVLRRVANSIRGTLRDTDSLGRIGGEEFCVILAESEAEGGKIVAERIRQRVSQLPMADLLDGRKVTVSIGICQVRDGHTSFFDVMNEADQAVLVAKRGGRDRIHLSTDFAGATAMAA